MIKETISKLMNLAVPAMLGNFLSLLQETINLVFIGQLNDKELLAAVGLGNSVFICFGVCIYFGLNSAMETLVCQAKGAGNTH